MLNKAYEFLSKLAPIYFRFRPKSYTRITRYAISVAALIVSPSLFELAVEYFLKYTLESLDNYNGFEYASWIIISALVFHFLSDLTDKSFRRLYPYKIKKEEQDKSSIKSLKKIFNYNYMKSNLERAEFGVSRDFVNTLSMAEIFFDPKYKLHDTELEKKRVNLIKEIIDYNYFLSIHLYPVHGNTNRFAIPGEWKHANLKDKYKKHAIKIKKRSSKHIKLLDDFYTKAKDKMLIEADN